jgi:phenylacetate-coenzyme A ligase PaaK-like adenylate-forming protein
MAMEADVAESIPPVPLLDALFELLPRLSWTSEQLRTHQRAALADVLRHAVERSVFPRERWAGIDVAEVVPDDLSGLPTMTKSDLMASWDSVVTDDRVTLAAARAHLDRVDTEGFNALDGDLLILTSGGSTGEPGVFCWSLPEMARFGASSIRWSAASGDGPPVRAAWVAARSPRHPSGAAAYISGAALIPVDQPLSAIVQQLNEVQPDALSTVCSMLPLLVDEARLGRLRVSIERLNVFGDALDGEAARAAEEVFGVEPVEGYPTTDVGYVAQQAPGECGLYLNEDLLLVETVDADDRLVPAGGVADHLLVTSLHQRTLPLIRYRIDDLVVVDPEPGRYAAYRRLASIDGRSDEVFRYGAIAVHPHVFRTAIGRLLDVRDYEVAQTGRGATVRVVGDSSPSDITTLRTELEASLRYAGLPDPVVDVTVVDRLPRTAAGKRRRFFASSAVRPSAT